MPRHAPPEFGEIGFAGAGLVDELTVKHYDQMIRQFEPFVEILADQQRFLPKQFIVLFRFPGDCQLPKRCALSYCLKKQCEMVAVPPR